MNINWQVLSVIILTMVVLMALAVVVVSYVRHWAARHEINESNLGEGKYFKRYVSKQDQAVHQARQAKIIEQKKKSIQRIKRLATGGFIASLLVGTGITLYVNRDNLATDITLTDEEISRLDSTHHHWKNIYPEHIPSLTQQLEKIKGNGLVLLSNKKTTGNLAYDRIKANARMVWEQFAEEHDITSVDCDWSQLQACLSYNQGAIFVLLPDFWQANTIQKMLASGASVLAYDAPLQVADPQKDNHFSIFDLTFSPASDKSHSVFALVGDKELSLGFDAGTIVDIESYSHFYKATSSRPQALAIDSSHIAGGNDLQTRLYAKAMGDGRLVWLDFSPNQTDHTDGINTEYFDGVLASVFRYLNKETYQSIATWPQAKPFAALIEEDTEDQFAEAERVSDFFLENNYPITWFMLSNLAQKNRALVRKLAESGQVACHGDNHRAFTLNDAMLQTERMALCQKMLLEITGKLAVSFRPPQEKHSDGTLDAMVNNGFTHYIANHGVDRFVPIIMRSKETGKELISVPRMVNDDFALWVEMEAGERLSKRVTSQEINYVKAVNGLYMFSFHSQFMSEDKYFSVVQHVANNVHKAGAYFATAQDISSWWKLRTQLMTGGEVNSADERKYKPMLLSVGASGKLQSQPYTSLKTVSK